MKKLLYSGLTALMLLFAFGTAKADNAKVKVELSRTTWALGSTTTTPQFTVSITQATTESGAETREGGLVLGEAAGNVAVKVTLTKDGTTKEQVITSSPVALTTTDLTAGTWSLTYAFVKGEAPSETFPDVDNDASTASLTIVNRVPVSLSANTWDGTTESALPKFTVTATDGITLGNAEGNAAVQVNFYKVESSPEVEFDQFIAATGETAIANPDNKLTEGVWMLSYSLVKGDDHTSFVEDGVDVDEANMQLTVGDVASVIATINFMPAKWTIGSEDGVTYSCSLSSETMSMGTEETDVAMMVTFTKGETIKNKLFTATFGEFNPSTDLGLTAGVWNLSYKFGKGNSTVENFVELTNIAAENAPATLTIEKAPEIELICQVMGPVGKNWPVVLSIESDNEEVGFGAYDVYYTLDGTAPSKTSTKVSGTGYDEDKGWNYATVRFTEACTLKAIAYVSYNDMEIASESIEVPITIFNGIPTPEFPVPAGNVASGTVLKLALPEVEIPGMGGPGVGLLTYDGNKVACNAFYTLDGSDPDVYAATIGAYMEEPMETTTQQYEARTGIEIEGEVGKEITVKVVYAYVSMETQMGYPSGVATAKYTIIAGIPAPEIDPFSGEVSVGDKVYITANDADEIYYSLNAEETLTVANGTKLGENVNYIEITADVAQGGSVKIQALAVKKGADGAEDVVSAVATANLTIKAPVTITFDPANGAEVEVGDKITLTPSREVQDMLYRWYASFQEAEDAEWDDEDAGYYSDGKPTVAADKLVLKVAYAEKGATETTDNYFYAIYTLKGSTPVDPVVADPTLKVAAAGKKTMKADTVIFDGMATFTMKVDTGDQMAKGDSLKFYTIDAEIWTKAGYEDLDFENGKITTLPYVATDTLAKLEGVYNGEYVAVFSLKYKQQEGAVMDTTIYFNVTNNPAPAILPEPVLTVEVAGNNTKNVDTVVFNGVATFKMKVEIAEGDANTYGVSAELFHRADYLNTPEDDFAKSFTSIPFDVTDTVAKLEGLYNGEYVVIFTVKKPASENVEEMEVGNDTVFFFNVTNYAEPNYVDPSLTVAAAGKNEMNEKTVVFDGVATFKMDVKGELAAGDDMKFYHVSADIYTKGAYDADSLSPDVTSFPYDATDTLAKFEGIYNGEYVVVFKLFRSTLMQREPAYIEDTAIYFNVTNYEKPVEVVSELTVKAVGVTGEEVVFTDKNVAFDMLVKDMVAGDSLSVSIYTKTQYDTMGQVTPVKMAVADSVRFSTTLADGEYVGDFAIVRRSDRGEDVVVGEAVTINFTVKMKTDTTAVETKELAGVNVYPNPTDGEFKVVAPANAQVEIFNVAGVLVKRLVVAEGNVQVRLNNSGIYFVRVRANGQMAVKKVVIR